MGRSPKGDPAPTPQMSNGEQLLDAQGRPRWRLRFTHPVTHQRVESKFAGTYQAAARELAKQMELASRGVLSDSVSKKTTLATYAPKWADRYEERAKAAGRARSTWMEHQGNVARYIVPTLKRFGWVNKRVNQFTYEDLEDLAASAQGTRKTDLSPSMRASITKTLRLIFGDLVEKGLIAKSPFEGRSGSWSPEPIDEYVPNLDEVQAVAAEMAQWAPNRRGGGRGAPEARLGAMVEFLAWTGLRVGEALALRLADVDGPDAEIRVTKQVTVAGGRKEEKDKPKTRTGSRSLPLLPQAEPAVRTLRAYATEVGSPFLFAGSARGGSPLSIGYGTLNRHFRRAITAAFDNGAVSSTDWTLHTLRHFYATTLLEAGIAPHQVSAWLGHSTPAITIAVYGARVERDRSSEAREFGRAIEWSLDPEAPRF